MRDFVVRFLEQDGTIRLANEDDQEYLDRLYRFVEEGALIEEMIGIHELDGGEYYE